MKILVVGAGSGGHVTPVIAVIREIWKQRPRAKIDFGRTKNITPMCVKMRSTMSLI